MRAVVVLSIAGVNRRNLEAMLFVPARLIQMRSYHADAAHAARLGHENLACRRGQGISGGIGCIVSDRPDGFNVSALINLLCYLEEAGRFPARAVDIQEKAV